MTTRAWRQFSRLFRLLLGHKVWPIALAGIGVLLALPSAWTGLFLDDYILWSTVSGAQAMRDIFPPQLNLWTFIDGDPERTRRMMDRGILPWWISDGARLSFWRPLTSMTHWLDFTRWPGQPILMHLHNLAWFGALVFVVALTYRQLMRSAWIAGFAALLYAFGGIHATVIAWISSRNTLLAALFGFLCLWAHDRWRRSGWRSGLWLSPSFLALGLMSSEAAVATGAYLVAHAVFLDRDTWPRRLFVPMLPCGLVIVVWQVMYQSLGYGVFAVSPMFVHPFHERMLFARRIVEHGPIFLLAQWTGIFPSSDYVTLTGSGAFVRWLAALTIELVLVVALIPLLRRDPVSRFFGLGHLLALAPIVAAPLTDRYAIFLGFGVMGLTARLIGSLLDRDSLLTASRGWRFLIVTTGCILAVVHILVSPVKLIHGSAVFPGDGGVLERSTLQLAPHADAKQIVIVNAPGPQFVIPILFMRAARGERIAAHTLALTYGTAPTRVFRAESRTVVVTPTGDQDFMFWPKGLRVGQEVRLNGTTIRVTALNGNGQPTEFRIIFDLPLEHPAIQWVRWTWRSGYIPFTPPAIGQTIEVASR